MAIREMYELPMDQGRPDGVEGGRHPLAIQNRLQPTKNPHLRNTLS